MIAILPPQPPQKQTLPSGTQPPTPPSPTPFKPYPMPKRAFVAITRSGPSVCSLKIRSTVSGFNSCLSPIVPLQDTKDKIFAMPRALVCPFAAGTTALRQKSWLAMLASIIGFSNVLANTLVISTPADEVGASGLQSAGGAGGEMMSATRWYEDLGTPNVKSASSGPASSSCTN